MNLDQGVLESMEMMKKMMLMILRTSSIIDKEIIIIISQGDSGKMKTDQLHLLDANISNLLFSPMAKL